MAAWTPGSYLVREYARHVERVDVFEDALDELANAFVVGRFVDVLLAHQGASSGGARQVDGLTVRERRLGAQQRER